MLFWLRVAQHVILVGLISTYPLATIFGDEILDGPISFALPSKGSSQPVKKQYC